jgi:phosphate transport system permease protein
MSTLASRQPWNERKLSDNLPLIIASIVPAAIASLIAILGGLDFSLALITIFVPVQIIAVSIVGFKFSRGRGVKDGLVIFATIFLSANVFVLLISVLYAVVVKGFSAMSAQFIIQNNVYVNTTTSLEYGGVGHAIVGTLLIVLITTIAAVPLGIAMAVFLTQSDSKTKGLIRTVTQALSGLPSVVSGLFILAFMGFAGLERSGFTGALALFPLMLPTVARVAEEALRLVPADLRLAALALGAPNYRAFFQVILPAAKSGIITALLLGLARVVGETAPLILTTNANNGTNLNPFAGGIATLPTYVYGFLGSGYQTSQLRAWGAALVLLILVGLLFGFARIVSRSKPAAKKSKNKKVK